jgi:hypothetical protein
MIIEIKRWDNRELLVSGEYVDLKDAVEKNKSNLQYADLQRADLQKADLDFSVMFFGCKDFNQKLDAKHFYQRLYHLLKQDYQDLPADVKRFINGKKIKELANRFHRVQECGKI